MISRFWTTKDPKLRGSEGGVPGVQPFLKRTNTSRGLGHEDGVPKSGNVPLCNLLGRAYSVVFDPGVDPVPIPRRPTLFDPRPSGPTPVPFPNPKKTIRFTSRKIKTCLFLRPFPHSCDLWGSATPGYPWEFPSEERTQRNRSCFYVSKGTK